MPELQFFQEYLSLVQTVLLQVATWFVSLFNRVGAWGWYCGGFLLLIFTMRILVPMLSGEDAGADSVKSNRELVKR